MEDKIDLSLTEEQCDLIIKAIEAYAFATNDVMGYGEIADRRNKIIKPIYDQMPDSMF